MSMPPKRLEELRLPALTATSGSSEDPKGTAYHLTLDADNTKHPVSTGISAHDRALAARLVASGAGPEQFTRPGHLVTLRYTVGGTRKRTGHTEAAVGELLFRFQPPPHLKLWQLSQPEVAALSLARVDSMPQINRAAWSRVGQRRVSV